MAKIRTLIALIIIFSFVLTPLSLPLAAETASAPTPADQKAMETDIGWPRLIEADGNSILVYQPQIEKWDHNKIIGRAAVSVTTKSSSRPTFGVIWLTARTETEKEKHLVHLEDFEVSQVSFPTAADHADEYKDILQKNLPQVSWTIALDRLAANIDITQAEIKTSPTLPLKNDPPKIYFSSTPAVLVLVDGKPALRKAESSELLRIINTRALILLDDKTGTYYLRVGEAWMQAKKLEGPWGVATNVPATVDKAKEDAVASQQVDLLNPADATTANAPTIFVSTVPAELIQTQGDFQFSPIPNTNLLYVTNTSSDIFLDTSTQYYYTVLSGRWFRSKTPASSWTYVPARILPADFRKISDTHPKGDILASVPETPQSKEAVIENSIPQTATVNRKEATLEVPYDGNAEFRDIEGTPLQYAVNTPVPVIRIDANTYYSVQNGVWFSATTPVGPWTVASVVPTVIYTIPPNSPLHYVTYVKVYGATPEVVYVGYTPGYLGSCVSADDVVVYGTGWYYPPYIGAYWVGYPLTYGFSVGFHSSWWFGWGWGFAFAPIYYPWWGPYWCGYGPHYHPYYHQHYWNNAPINNYYHNNHFRNINHVNMYNRWQKNVVVRSFQQPTGGHLRASVPRTSQFKGTASGSRGSHNNVFAGHDGNVYRHSPERWEKNDGQKWHAVSKEGGSRALAPQLARPLFNRNESVKHLDQENQARAVGEQRWQKFNQNNQKIDAGGGRSFKPSQQTSHPAHSAGSAHVHSSGGGGGVSHGGGGGGGSGGHAGGGGHR